MTDAMTNILQGDLPVDSTLESAVLVVASFTAAWGIARFSGFAARRVLAWNDRRESGPEPDPRRRVGDVMRRETSVGVVRAAISLLAFVAAAIFGVAQLTGGFDKLTALAGASFALIVAGFAIQRVLIDMIAGLTMFFERWYSVGDTIQIPMLDMQGVVEDVSLRSTKLRTLTGEVIRVHNSQIPAVKVLPRGVKVLTTEFFVNDKGRGEQLVERVAALVPEGPTAFIKRPALEQVEDLSESLIRIKMRATVAPGREWLAEGFLSSMLKEQAGDELIVHGPVVLSDDEGATKSFARAAARSSRRAA